MRYEPKGTRGKIHEARQRDSSLG